MVVSWNGGGKEGGEFPMKKMEASGKYLKVQHNVNYEELKLSQREREWVGEEWEWIANGEMKTMAADDDDFGDGGWGMRDGRLFSSLKKVTLFNLFSM